MTGCLYAITASVSREAGLKKVGLELGGKNGIIVMDDADLGLALDGVLWGAFGTTGRERDTTNAYLAAGRDWMRSKSWVR